ncbi:hypothetical protein POF51_29520 [Brevibacillus sp. AG]|uniref:hypothetical protein n=1 Tax=Brevibacillus sp. AG TaxID=3020891 RepID=UPI0023308B28|nr:hypothetical protein [Brevibacillus sp. AG]MDC0764864.1 hypothetical protein [Brevibacillus sp. AG]
MNITNEEYINTGGGCMVYSLWIDGGGNVKSINFNEEVVAGCNITYDDCEGFNETNDVWVESYDLSLPLEKTLGSKLNEKGVPSEIVDRILHIIHNIIWKDRD